MIISLINYRNINLGVINYYFVLADNVIRRFSLEMLLTKNVNICLSRVFEYMFSTLYHIATFRCFILA